MRQGNPTGSTVLGLSPSRWVHVLALFLAFSFVSPLRAQDVLTYHNDNARTGQNLNEMILTPSNVNATQFGKIFQVTVDGKVDAQPLYASAVAIPAQGAHNVLFVATEHGSVYAFDADAGTQLWQVSLVPTGETTSDDRGCSQITPEIGITSTPVIDRSSGPNGAIYAVTMTKDSSSAYHQRLHALDITTGAELFGGPTEVQATFPGKGDNSNGTSVIFDPGQYAERAGLLLLNQVIYTGWTSHCDDAPYTAWVIAYSESTLKQANVLDLTPNGDEGSIWMSGAGLAADPAGYIYPLVANGTFDTTLTPAGLPSLGDYGNAFMKLSTANAGLVVADYFTMSNTVSESNADEDLGSGGALVLPDMTDASGVTHHLAVGAGKDQAIYLVDRDSMGKFNPNADNIYQELLSALPGGIWSMPAYFNGRLYYGPVGNNLLAFQFSNAKLQTSPVSSTSAAFAYPGATPSISANGTSNGIVWVTENTSPAVLHAYDATNLSNELYNSNQMGARDQFGAGNKFITPTIANGKVYVGTTNGVGAFGLLASVADFTLAVASGGSASASVTPGQTAQYSLTMTALGGFNQPVSFTCSGAPTGAICSISTTLPSGSSAAAVMVSVSTTAPSQTPERRWLGPKDPPAPGWMWLAVVLLLSTVTAAVKLGRRRIPVVLGVCALAVVLWAGCGGGGGGGPNPMTNPGTPAGTYTLTVTGSATSGSTTLSHNITLQFVVN
jgi:outer membrane protein assembly factor BamB